MNIILHRDFLTSTVTMCEETAKKILSASNVILLDIEGTTTSISFVKDELFPYAEKFLADYVKSHWDDDKMQEIVAILIKDQEAVKNNEGFMPLSSVPSSNSEITDYIDTVISHLKWQQSKDFKSTGLKRIQGYIWKEGYLNKSIKGHLYDDVPEALKKWKQMNKKIFIYSSGSIDAQKLLFCNSAFGNLDTFIDGNFDTTVGSKIESESYLKISESIEEKPENIVFFTDRPKEVAAAKKSGIRVIRMERKEPNIYLEEEKEFLGLEDVVLTSFVPLIKASDT